MKITCIFRRFDYYRQAWFFPGINFIKKSGENSRTAFLSLFFALCKEYVPRSKFSTYLWPTFCAGERLALLPAKIDENCFSSRFTSLIFFTSVFDAFLCNRSKFAKHRYLSMIKQNILSFYWSFHIFYLKKD